MLATVHGPKGANHRDQRHDTAVLDVVWRSRHDTGAECDAGDKAINQHTVRRVLESAMLLDAHPRASITVTCTVLFDDGAAVACAVNAACAALVNAGLAMRGMCGALHMFVKKCTLEKKTGAVAAVVDPQGVTLVDCTQSEEQQAIGRALVVGLLQNSQNSPLMVEVEGVMGSAGEVDALTRSCLDAVEQVGGALQRALKPSP